MKTRLATSEDADDKLIYAMFDKELGRTPNSSYVKRQAAAGNIIVLLDGLVVEEIVGTIAVNFVGTSETPVIEWLCINGTDSSQALVTLEEAMFDHLRKQGYDFVLRTATHAQPLHINYYAACGLLPTGTLITGDQLDDHQVFYKQRID